MGEGAAGSLEQRMVSQEVGLAAERMRKKVEEVPRRNLTLMYIRETCLFFLDWGVLH